MAFDSPSTTLPQRKKGRLTKTEMKMSLVAKRLLMLQDDDHHIVQQPVVAEVPRQYESESTKLMEENMVNDPLPDDKQIMSSSDEQKNCESTKAAREMNDDSSSEDTMHLSTVIGRKHGRSYKRLRVVVDDDDESEDRELVWTEQKKKSSQRRKLDYNLPENINFSAMDRAEEVQANLPAEYPSFVKLMSRSHVTQGFWLGLPRKFRTGHLPDCDSIIMLVDENGKKWKTKFLAQKSGLSAGWREFAIKQNLHEGDVVVFHLVNPTTFKVYIIRADSLGEVDGVLGLLNLDASLGQCTSEDCAEKIAHNEGSPALLEDNVQGNSDLDLDCEVVDGIHFSDAVITFEEMKSFDNFNIVVDGLVIDSKFNDKVRMKYYELCSSQRMFLHERLLKGLNFSLVVGIITEIVNISDAVRACRASTSYDDLCVWKQTLKGFEFLGMKVSFLCERLDLLLGIASSESNLIDERTRFEQARLAQAQAEDRMKALEIKLLELKETMEKIDLEIGAEMQASARKHARIIELATAPW